jgi:hypothetical protein
MVRSSSESGTSSVNSSTSGSGRAAEITACTCTDAHHAVTLSCSCRNVTASSGDSFARSTIRRTDIINGPGSTSTTRASNAAGAQVNGSMSSNMCPD